MLTNFAHLNIEYSDNEEDKSALRIWIRSFQYIETASKKNIIDPFVDVIHLSHKESNPKILSILITGREMFLGIYDKKIISTCSFEDVKNLPFTLIKNIIQEAELQTIPRYMPHLLSEWGKAIPKIIMDEGGRDSVELRLKISKIQTKLENIYNPMQPYLIKQDLDLTV